MTKRSKTLVILAGPTAVGKTDLSLKLAKRFNTEIISADSRQFYKEMELGTAKPTEAETEEVPHHFVNSLSIHENYNAGRFEKEALSLIDILFQQHDVLFVVGGSGLYVKALCEGIDDMPAIPASIRMDLNEEYKQHGVQYLQEQLLEIDPDYYHTVDLKNPQRLIRALEVYRATGRNMSFYRAKEKNVSRPFDIIKIGIERPREELYQRINMRMDKMIAQGLFEEAERLFPFKELNALQTVGYSEIFGFLEGNYDKEEAVRLLKRNSRRYAKRQMTWFKRDTDFTWFSAEDKEKVINFLERKLNE